MLVGLLKLVFTLASWALLIGGWVILIYTIMTWVMPQNKYTMLVGKYLEPVLAPIRSWLRKKLPNLPLDVSPAVLWLGTVVGRWVLNVLQFILIGQ